LLTGGSPAALAPIQAEAYVQLMKQLSANPSPASERLGWQLMALFVRCFPPDPPLDKFVERFVRTRTSPAHARRLLELMCSGMRTGALRSVPPESQLAAMLAAADGSYAESGKPGKAPREEEHNDGPPVHPPGQMLTGMTSSGQLVAATL
jgi:hypothetical protein